MRVRLLLLLLVLALTVSEAAATIELQPLVVGWEQFFKLEWSAGERAGRPVVQGYILNDSGFPAVRIRLLVDALDEGGSVIRQRVSWLGGDLMPGVRIYFEAPAPQRSTTYRVSVFSFERVEAEGDRRD